MECHCHHHRSLSEKARFVNETAFAPVASDTDDTQDNRPSRGRPRDAEKNSAILEAAGALFLENGFDGTSMDEVAKRAGVSKQTVYSHFSSKEQLFGAAIRQKIEAHYPDVVLGRISNHTLEADLEAVSEAYARLLLSPEAIAVHRLLAGASGNAELTRLFWEAGPNEMEAKLQSFLQGWVDRGALRIDEMEEACGILFSLLKGGLHFELTIGLLDAVTDEQIDRQVARAVKAFLSLYRA